MNQSVGVRGGSHRDLSPAFQVATLHRRGPTLRTAPAVFHGRAVQRCDIVKWLRTNRYWIWQAVVGAKYDVLFDGCERRVGTIASSDDTARKPRQISICPLDPPVDETATRWQSLNTNARVTLRASDDGHLPRGGGMWLPGKPHPFPIAYAPQDSRTTSRGQAHAAGRQRPTRGPVRPARTGRPDGRGGCHLMVNRSSWAFGSPSIAK